MHDVSSPNWQGVSQVPMTPFQFTGKPGVADEVLGCDDPVNIFKLIVTNELVDLIVCYTNRYAEQELKKIGPLSKRSRLSKWKPVTSDEIYLYLIFTFG